MKTMMVITILLSLLGNIAFADCQHPVNALQAGQPAPCTGYLFTIDAEKNNRKQLTDLGLANQQVTDLNQALSAKNKQVQDLTDANNLSQQQSKTWEVEAEKQAKAAQEAMDKERRSVWVHLGEGAAIIIILDIIAKKTIGISF